jgi:Ca2+-binding RTX toxin-like protein
MPTALDSILAAIRADAGLRGNVSARDIDRGVAAADDLNTVLLRVLDRTNGNDDKVIDKADMIDVSNETYARPRDYVDFLEGHGNDNGTVESGYHYVQDDGGSLLFQGRNFLDTVADAIYHFGFDTKNGRYFNEDGNDNERVQDVAGWLNFFLNGRTMVYGGDGNDEFGSGEYSDYFAKARNETFMGYGGDDAMWSDRGNDKVYGGSGNDRSGMGTGNDSGYGGTGNDSMWGETGSDKVYGGTGKDVLGGGLDGDDLYGGDDGDNLMGNEGRDELNGGSGRDRLEGGADNDTLNGDFGRDDLMGGDGDDKVRGGDSNDKLSGNEGRDTLRGDDGTDAMYLWENAQVRDTLVFKDGDSGRTLGNIDLVEGFVSGTDKIDLSSFGAMKFAGIDFTGGGKASCYFDGTYLRIDDNGDRATDMMVEFKYVDRLSAGDFIFA